MFDTPEKVAVGKLLRLLSFNRDVRLPIPAINMMTSVDLVMFTLEERIEIYNRYEGQSYLDRLTPF